MKPRSVVCRMCGAELRTIIVRVLVPVETPCTFTERSLSPTHVGDGPLFILQKYEEREEVPDCPCYHGAY